MQYLPFVERPKDEGAQARNVSAASKSVRQFMDTHSNLSQAKGEEQSPMQRWKLRNQSMMESGNPLLQKQAMKEQEIYARSMAESHFADKSPTSFREYQLAQKDPDYLKHIIEMKQLGGMKIDLGEQKFLSAAEADKMEMKHEDGSWGPLKPGLKFEDIRDPSSFRYKDNLAADSAGKYAMLDTALENMDIIDNLLFDENGTVRQDVLTGVTGIDTALKVPVIGKFLGMAAKSRFRGDAPLVQQALETGIQAITRTETGAAMASEEIDNVKARFMPVKGDSDALVKQKLEAYRHFISTAIGLIKTKKGKGKHKNELTSDQIKDLVDSSLANLELSQQAEQQQSMDSYLPEGATWYVED